MIDAVPGATLRAGAVAAPSAVLPSASLPSAVPLRRSRWTPPGDVLAVP